MSRPGAMPLVHQFGQIAFWFAQDKQNREINTNVNKGDIMTTLTKQEMPTFKEWYEFETNREGPDKIELGDIYNAQLIYLMIKVYHDNAYT
jgi:hypothetical protein